MKSWKQNEGNLEFIDLGKFNLRNGITYTLNSDRAFIHFFFQIEINSQTRFGKAVAKKSLYCPQT